VCLALGFESEAEWQVETTGLALLQVLPVTPNALCRRSAEPCCAQVRLAHRVAELENLPYGLSAKAPVLKVRAAPPSAGQTLWSRRAPSARRAGRQAVLLPA
jgi:hypothetical protein